MSLFFGKSRKYIESFAILMGNMWEPQRNLREAADEAVLEKNHTVYKYEV